MSSKRMKAVCVVLAVFLICVLGLYIEEKISDSKNNDRQTEAVSGNGNLVAIDTVKYEDANVEDTNEGESEDQTTTEEEKVDYSEFLNSQEGRMLKTQSFQFAKAYLTGDEEYIKNCLIDQDKIQDTYQYTFNDLEYMEFRFYSYDEENKTAYVDYILGVDNDQGYDYLDISWKLVDGEWKVEWYGLEK